MSGTIDARLAELGLTLPEPVAPLAAYVPYVQTGNLVFVSGQLPIGPNGLVTGHLTSADNADGVPAPDSTLAKAQEAAGLCALNLLAHVRNAIGDLDRVQRVVKLTGFVSCDAGFVQQPQVINGASELMGAVFGDAGQHSRAAVGSSALPLGAIVEVEGIFEVA